MEKSLNFRKNFIWKILGTSFNAFNSLFFMIAVTRINGLEDAGVFTLAFSTACILYMIGIYAGRIYQVTESDKSITDKDYIANRVISCVGIIIIGLIFVAIRGYDFYKSMIFVLLAIFKALEALSDVFYGIMQKNDLLSKAGKSCFIKAVLSVVAFVVIDIITKNLTYACASIVIIFALIILFYDIKNVKNFIDSNTKVKIKSILNIFKNGFFTFAIAFLGLYMTNAPKYSIDSFLTEDIQGIFGIIIMPATVMSLLAQFLIHPYLNEFFELYKNQQYDKLKKLLFKIIIIIGVIGIAGSIAGYLLGTQILGIVYGIDLSAYKVQLFMILIAATFYTMAGIISPILITMRCTVIQFFVYMAISVFEFVVCNILVSKFNINGAVNAYFITMILYFLVFYVISLRIINKKKMLNNEGRN